MTLIDNISEMLGNTSLKIPKGNQKRQFWGQKKIQSPKEKREKNKQWSTMDKLVCSKRVAVPVPLVAPIVLFFIVITTSGTNPWSFVTYIPQLTPGYGDDRKTFEMTTSIYQQETLG